MAINVDVNINEITISTIATINEGEYGVNDCIFSFSSEYDNLIKRAVFSSGTYDETYVVEIVNDTCKIPEGILLLQGNIILGVYAYSIENNELILRYSPIPAKFFVERGSYIQNASNYFPAKPIGDLIDEYNRNAAAKLLEFNENAAIKTTEFDSHVDEKIDEFDANARIETQAFIHEVTEATNIFNHNANNKTTEFNANAQNLQNDFNANAINKTNDFNQNATTKTNELNQIAEGIEDMTTAIQFATFEVDNNMGLYIIQANRMINTNFIFNQETGGLEVKIV